MMTTEDRTSARVQKREKDGGKRGGTDDEGPGGRGVRATGLSCGHGRRGDEGGNWKSGRGITWLKAAQGLQRE